MSKRSNVGAPMDRLNGARSSFNNYMEGVVKPLLKLDQHELDRLRFVEIGEKIAVEEIRQDYRERAIALLEANVECYGPSATIRIVPETDSKFVVASTLVVSALGYMFASGIVSALVVAAIWYWLAADTSFRRRRSLLEEIREHNDEVPEWEKTINDWKADLLALRLMESR